MRIETFNVIKYGLKSRTTTSLEIFKKKDVKHDKIDERLCSNMMNAAKAYQQEETQRLEEKEEKVRALNLQQEKMESRALQKRDQQTAA